MNQDSGTQARISSARLRGDGDALRRSGGHVRTAHATAHVTSTSREAVDVSAHLHTSWCGP
eukprot:CAMPEP_0206236340 /NCGR_PEP_ID=MMETSP0047_2-20121206/13664_1 /ASSEMBLY_ACC=CAM_ASM_000192 /TAXON_ID=195065 /ORGANISM="Chroomonas mesostigmatica_cf, Strain CCMP1168" /LENGTH=60 /DNA_ID=CAMNT_0053660671 /DNA_START=23 /DNA_END=205 /DNA_ORIENTATION=+